MISDPDTFRTLGRAWPLLAGERGEYAVTRGDTGMPQLRAMARAAGPSDMMAEQVWDGRRPSVALGARPAGVDHAARHTRRPAPVVARRYLR